MDRAGSHGAAGRLEIEAAPGAVIATGQKDLRTRRTGTIFFKVLDGLQLQETDHRGAVEFLRGQDPAAAKDAALRRVKALMRIHGIGIDELT